MRSQSQWAHNYEIDPFYRADDESVDDYFLRSERKERSLMSGSTILTTIPTIDYMDGNNSPERELEEKKHQQLIEGQSMQDHAPYDDYGDDEYEYVQNDYVINQHTSLHNRMAVALLWIFVLMTFSIIGMSLMTRDLELIDLPSASAGLTDDVSEQAVNIQPVTAGSGPNNISPVFSPEVQYWGSLITQWSAEFGLDPNMVATVMQIESCGDPQAESYAGAQGLFQVMPFHFAAGENMQDPATNAKRGINYLSERLVQTSGDVGRAFAGYNGGHVAAAAPMNQWAHETQRYFYWGTGIYEDARTGKQSSERLQEWMQAGGASLCQQAASRIGLAP